MLTVHHLGKSQSERVVWLCEELAIDYELKCYVRNAVNILAPPELRAVGPAGTAPMITDGEVVIAESGAIVQYIIAKYGNGRLALEPGHPDFAQYLYWFHFANGNIQPHMGRNMMLNKLDLPKDNPVLLSARERLERAFNLVETRLGEKPYFSGSEFTAADIMNVFSLTTMRYFTPVDLTPYPNIRAYLQRMGQRQAYRAAMKKGDPDMPLLLT